MKEHLKSKPAAGVSVAVVNETNELNEENYFVYLINDRADTLKNCIVVSRGYGLNVETNEKVETSVLRHVVEELAPKSFVKIEPIMPEVFGLNNEYWVSFWIDDDMFDKRYIFLPESIKAENMVSLPLMQQKGVLIQ
jgi:hypothetical protein